MVKTTKRLIVILLLFAATAVVLFYPKHVMTNSDKIIMADFVLKHDGDRSVNFFEVPESQYETLQAILLELSCRNTLVYSTNGLYSNDPSLVLHVAYKTAKDQVRVFSMTFWADYSYGPVIVDSGKALKQIIINYGGLEPRLHDFLSNNRVNGGQVIRGQVNFPIF